MANLQAEESRRVAQDALERSPIPALRRIRVEKDGATIVLFGHVDSFYQKQLAQELVRSATRDVELINSVDVS